MKKILEKSFGTRDFIKLVAVGMLIVAMVGFPNISKAAEKYRFKFVTHEPATSFTTRALWFYWCDQVEQLSGGAIKFDRYPGEILVKGQDSYEAVRDGIVQSGLVIVPWEAGQMPLATIKELPFSFVSITKHNEMVHKFLEAGLQDYFHTLGFHYIVDATNPAYGFWTNKKWGPIRRLEDLKGCKIRSPGGYISKALEAMGATPVTIPSPEIYTAMERGTIDGNSTVESANIAFRLHEVTAYITRSNYGTTGAPIGVNLKVWNSLPKDIQKIMEQAGRDAEAYHAKENDKYEKEVIDPTVLKSGIQIIPLSKEEKERMKKACAPVWDE